MLHVFVGKDAERQGIMYGALHQLPVVRVSEGVRTAAAVLGLSSTAPISLAWYKLFNDVPRSGVICDITDSIMLEKIKETRHELHGEGFRDVDLKFGFMPIPQGGELPLADRAGLAVRALLLESTAQTNPVLEYQLREAIKPLVLLGAAP